MQKMNSDESDRRSSVRVRSLLPALIQSLNEEELEAYEARILDLAVLESDGVKHEMADWSERSDEVPRDVLFVLNEIRAMRQQLTELQRQVELNKNPGMEPRWLTINDRGLFVDHRDSDAEFKVGDFVEIKLQIPSIHTPEIMAVGEVVRVTTDGSEGPGFGVAFRQISETHSKAIIRYALRRERQMARSVRFH